MRVRLNSIDYVLLRAVALVFVVIAIALAVMQSRRADGDRIVARPIDGAVDPLATDLARCRTVTPEQLAADYTCLRAWAESRRRFFAPSHPVSAPTRTSEAR